MIFALLGHSPASDAFPHSRYKTRLTAVGTALLAAIVQHSSIRSGIQQQNIVTYATLPATPASTHLLLTHKHMFPLVHTHSVSWADLLMGVVYLLILTAFLSAVVVAVLHNSVAWRTIAPQVHNSFRLLALSELLLLSIFSFENPAGLAAWATAVSAVLFSWLSLLALDRLRFERERRVGAELSAQLLPVEVWAVPDVRAWLLHCPIEEHSGGGSGGFGIAVAERRQYAHALAQQRIDGPALCALTLADVRSMGVPLGHAMKLHKAIARLGKHGIALPPSPRPPRGIGFDDNEGDGGLRSDESEGELSDGGADDSGESALLGNSARARPLMSSTSTSPGGVVIEMIAPVVRKRQTSSGST